MSQAIRLRIYCDSRDRVGGEPLARAVVQLLWREHAAGVTVLRGEDGFGAHRHRHTGRDVLGSHHPVVIEWLDAPDRHEALWPLLQPLVAQVLVTREPVDVVAWPGHGMRLLDTVATVEEVMSTDVVTVRAEASLRDVVDLMLQRGRRFVPVLDHGQLVGVITNGDLVQRAGLAARLELPQPPEPGHNPASTGMTAREVMTDEPVAVLAGTKLADSARLMVSHRVKRLPVLRQGRVVGVVSRFDVLRTVADDLGNGNGEADIGGPAARIGQLAHGRVPSVPADADLPRVLDVVASTRLNHAVVVDADRRVVGLISDIEVLRRVGPGQRAVLDRLMRRSGHVAGNGQRAADLMVPVELVVPASLPLVEAIRQMMAQKVKVLPLVDDDGRLVGIVDRADALRAAFGGVAGPDAAS